MQIIDVVTISCAEDWQDNKIEVAAAKALADAQKHLLIIETFHQFVGCPQTTKEESEMETASHAQSACIK